MKQFACGDVIPGCTAQFEAESEDAVLQQVASHAAADHGVATVPPELVEQVRAKISDR